MALSSIISFLGGFILPKCNQNVDSNRDDKKRATAICMSGQVRSLTTYGVFTNIKTALLDPQAGTADLFLRLQLTDSYFSRPMVCHGNPSFLFSIILSSK